MLSCKCQKSHNVFESTAKMIQRNCIRALATLSKLKGKRNPKRIRQNIMHVCIITFGTCSSSVLDLSGISNKSSKSLSVTVVMFKSQNILLCCSANKVQFLRLTLECALYKLNNKNKKDRKLVKSAASREMCLSDQILKCALKA